MKNNRTNILITVLMLLTPSCAFMSESPEEANQFPESAGQTEEVIPENQNSPSKVSIEDLEQNRSRTLSDIEVTWQIPEETVEGYFIKYGYQSAQLDKQIKVRSEALEKSEDAKHGFVYRFVLTGIPMNKEVYISIAAYNGNEVSPATDTFKVSAN